MLHLACCTSVSHSIEIANHSLTNRIFPWIWCWIVNTLGVDLRERNLVWKEEKVHNGGFLFVVKCINAITYYKCWNNICCLVKFCLQLRPKSVKFYVNKTNLLCPQRYSASLFLTFISSNWNTDLKVYLEVTKMF